MTTVQKMNEYDQSPSCWYDDQVSFMPSDLESPTPTPNYPSSYCKPEIDQLMQYNNNNIHHSQNHNNAFLQLPHLIESPKLTTQSQPSTLSYNNNAQHMQYFHQYHHHHQHSLYGGGSSTSNDEQVTDWRVLDKFVASQLSQDQDHVSKQTILHVAEQITLLANKKPEMSEEHASTNSTSSCHNMELWK